jgi:hypothetical protein
MCNPWKRAFTLEPLVFLTMFSTTCDAMYMLFKEKYSLQYKKLKLKMLTCFGMI